MEDRLERFTAHDREAIAKAIRLAQWAEWILIYCPREDYDVDLTPTPTVAVG